MPCRSRNSLATVRACRAASQLSPCAEPCATAVRKSRRQACYSYRYKLVHDIATDWNRDLARFRSFPLPRLRNHEPTGLDLRILHANTGDLREALGEPQVSSRSEMVSHRGYRGYPATAMIAVYSAEMHRKAPRADSQVSTIHPASVTPQRSARVPPRPKRAPNENRRGQRLCLLVVQSIAAGAPRRRSAALAQS